MPMERRLTGANVNIGPVGVGLSWENAGKALPSALDDTARKLVAQMIDVVTPKDVLQELADRRDRTPGLTLFCGLYDETGRELGTYYPEYDKAVQDVTPVDPSAFREIQRALTELVDAGLLVLEDETENRKVYRLRLPRNA